MPKNGEAAIGRGLFTPIKQRDLENFLRQYLQVCQSVLTKHQAWARPKLFIADITAGKGIHPETGEDGSPLILLRLLEEFQMNYNAFFIEQQPDNFATLQGVVQQQFLDVLDRCWFYCGDHVQLVDNLVHQCVPMKSYGLIYYDFTTENFARSLEFLAKLYQFYRDRLRRIDCLLYLSATAIKRVRRAFPEHADLLTFLQQIRKKQWLVREPSGANQYTFLLGTNYVDYRTSNQIGLFPITEPRGKAILEKLNYTAAEWLERETPPLFPARQEQRPVYLFPAPRSYQDYLRHPQYLAVRARVVERAAGLCECCRQQPLTEVHHLRYAPKGTLDVMEDLMALCHACHCQIHGKER